MAISDLRKFLCELKKNKKVKKEKKMACLVVLTLLSFDEKGGVWFVLCL